MSDSSLLLAQSACRGRGFSARVVGSRFAKMVAKPEPVAHRIRMRPLFKRIGIVRPADPLQRHANAAEVRPDPDHVAIGIEAARDLQARHREGDPGQQDWSRDKGALLITGHHRVFQIPRRSGAPSVKGSVQAARTGAGKVLP
jgi:hypothetical protein